jgi:transaldolase
MKTNYVRQLESLGQAAWLDFISRDLINSGKLARLIKNDGLRGMTSNPAIFEKSIMAGSDYDRDIRTLAAKGESPRGIYDALTLSDVGAAADEFRPVYDALDGWEGFVSLEVDPHLAHDAARTVSEARRLWTALKRPNIMIKVPATRAGLVAIRQLTSEGINVNVTLLFGLPRYREVAAAFIGGLDARASKGLPVKYVASVASFFISRIDALVDPLLEPTAARGGARGKLAAALRGRVAIASAQAAYQTFKEIYGGKKFQKLDADGARPQRLLWASTGTKDPGYSDVKYVEALIGADTINTLPLKTLDAYRDHGSPALRLTRGLPGALAILADLPKIGLDIDALTQRLENEGVEKFKKPYDTLLAALGKVASLAKKP